MNGALVWQAKYKVFGQATVEIDTLTNNLRFPGQYYDTEPGLHYNWFRYYVPGIGRYMAMDPIGHREGKNLFSYALSHPAKETDPLGL